MKKITLLAVLIISFPFNSLAGAWTNAEGESTLINSFYYWHFNQFKDSKGVVTDQPDFMKIEYKPYYEYGVMDGLSAGFSPSFQHVMGEYVHAFESGIDTNEAFTGSDIFVKKRIYKNDEHQIAVSVIPLIEIPGIYKEEKTPFFGKQESFWNMILSAGKNTYKIGDNYGYVNIEAGIRSRFSEAFTDESGASAKLDVVASFPYTKRKKVNLGATYTKSISGYTGGALSFLSKYGYDSTQFSISESVQYNNWGLDYGYIYQPDARNTGIGSGFKLSITHKF